MPVVTISRQYGAGGSSVAALVAEAIGTEVLDKKIIEQIAAKLSLEPSEVEEESERPRTMFENLVRSFSSLEPGMGAGWTPPYPDPLFDPHKEIVALTEQLIRETANTGNAVIVGRGAGFVLKDLPGVFRVFLWAPKDVRLKALQARFGFSEADAARKMHETDSNRAAYTRQLYGRNWTDPEGYDLTVNTARVGYQATADMILRAVKR